MTGKAGLKAGWISIAVLVVWTVIARFLPLAGALVWASSCVNLLLYACIGVLAGHILSPPRTPGKGAGAGAIAGLMGGIVSGVIGLTIMAIQLASGAGIAGLPPEQMQQLEQLLESGMSPTTFALMTSPSLICVLAIGSGLAAAGGAIYSAIRSD